MVISEGSEGVDLASRRSVAKGSVCANQQDVFCVSSELASYSSKSSPGRVTRWSWLFRAKWAFLPGCDHRGRIQNSDWLHLDDVHKGDGLLFLANLGHLPTLPVAMRTKCREEFSQRKRGSLDSEERGRNARPPKPQLSALQKNPLLLSCFQVRVFETFSSSFWLGLMLLCSLFLVFHLNIHS